MKKILIIDNYDSFTYNLKQLVMSSFNGPVDVFRNDEIGINYISDYGYSGIIISPGPKKPAYSGISMRAIKKYYKEMPVLGVCLGMQCINEVFGGKTVKAPKPVHGKASIVYHTGSRLFRNIPEKFKAARYHSLIIEPNSDSHNLSITSYTKDRIPMSIEHKKYPLFGVQFHPESFMTEFGKEIIENYLEFIK